MTADGIQPAVGSGPDSSLAPIVLAVVLALSGGDPMRAIMVASMMAIVWSRC